MAASTIVPLQGSTATQPTEVSIIMPAHNAAKTIKASVESVLAQTHTDWKLHVVDDGSTDRTAEIIGTFAQADTRILLHRPGRLGSAGAARNHAMAQASSQYLAFLDADDLWLPQKLQRQLACLQSGNAIAFSHPHTPAPDFPEADAGEQQGRVPDHACRSEAHRHVPHARGRNP
jgi:glycosyltransferase involved in cell wall biosynthesis